MDTQLSHTHQLADPPRPSADPLTNRATVATMLCTSERHIRRLVATGGLPMVKVGGKVRFRLRDVEAYMTSHTVLRPVVGDSAALPDRHSSPTVY